MIRARRTRSFFQPFRSYNYIQYSCMNMIQCGPASIGLNQQYSTYVRKIYEVLTTCVRRHVVPVLYCMYQNSLSLWTYRMDDGWIDRQNAHDFQKNKTKTKNKKRRRDEKNQTWDSRLHQLRC